MFILICHKWGKRQNIVGPRWFKEFIIIKQITLYWLELTRKIVCGWSLFNSFSTEFDHENDVLTLLCILHTETTWSNVQVIVRKYLSFHSLEKVSLEYKLMKRISLRKNITFVNEAGKRGRKMYTMYLHNNNYFNTTLEIWYSRTPNSVISDVTGPSILARCGREFVITMNIYVVKWLLADKNWSIFCTL